MNKYQALIDQVNSDPQCPGIRTQIQESLAKIDDVEEIDMLIRFLIKSHPDQLTVLNIELSPLLDELLYCYLKFRPDYYMELSIEGLGNIFKLSNSYMGISCIGWYAEHHRLSRSCIDVFMGKFYDSIKDKFVKRYSKEMYDFTSEEIKPWSLYMFLMRIEDETVFLYYMKQLNLLGGILQFIRGILNRIFRFKFMESFIYVLDQAPIQENMRDFSTCFYEVSRSYAGKPIEYDEFIVNMAGKFDYSDIRTIPHAYLLLRMGRKDNLIYPMSRILFRIWLTCGISKYFINCDVDVPKITKMNDYSRYHLFILLAYQRDINHKGIGVLPVELLKRVVFTVANT